MRIDPPSASPRLALLLCGRFSRGEGERPLNLREYNLLEDWLAARGLTAGRMTVTELSGIAWEESKLDPVRVRSLLGRGGALALAVEAWSNAGIWVVSRDEDAYPSRILDHLGRSAPAVLYGVGDPTMLDRGGLSIVGSRDVDADGEAFTTAVAQQCANEGIPVVSGGARGVDQIALSTAFEEGGSVVAALPEGLGRAAVAAKYREGIREERLVLVSPYAPHVPFSVGNAMGRNRLIYALGDAALVVSTAVRSGGTWAGAEEELKRDRPRMVYVRCGDGLAANATLLEIGGTPFPSPPWTDGLSSLLRESPKDVSTGVSGGERQRRLF